MAIKSSIGVLGGTFDPIHFAHLRLAEEVAEAFMLNTVRLIPSANPPHRITPSAPAEDRLKMVELALDRANKKLVPDGRELNRIGKSYMVDTLKQLRTEHSNASISLILGTDAFIELMTWHEWQQLFSLANIIVASRPNLPLSKLENNLEQRLASEYETRKRHDRDLLHSSENGLIFTYEFTSLEVSGTSLRRRIQRKQSLKYLLPDNVINYIQNHDLYKEKTSESKPK
ncbi:MAG: nicotinate-nucleotide adenylyltransferase [Burkholderiales bacterium]|nr:nicotinate-nucleotide adenylyltransferase [Burkholderiales bacterium]MBL6879605.1 nicotinate-nucleotide adenylyltransferase [Burkholderiales bacterium]MDA0360523.1 nicotinate-nucleotide adenylyltransferase [Pseudomonadota bacterium]MDA0862153.1 nicotinate-nucleotide adenylyltransferase [Pseudomonadota bacterium]MDA1030193.1 nicotinate-nucleotide adenylyltransferase [Pseudomonadota bacterium]